MVHSMDRDAFILQYLEDHGTYGVTSPFLLHVRIATHGSIGLANCHPFAVPVDGDGEMVMIHNGIIDKIEDAIEDTDLTDTEGLVKHVLTDMHDEWLDNEFLVTYIEGFIGWSKLAFLTTSPALMKELYILNEDSGIWKEDVWFSNYSCFPYKQNYKKVSAYVRKQGYGTPSEDTKTAHTWYKNGVEYSGKWDSTWDEEDCGFEAWLIDPEERRVQAGDLAEASHDDHIDYFNQSLSEGDACPVCTGITGCICDDICCRCYEAYHECDCYGKFVSVTESFEYKWGERIVAIADEAFGSKVDPPSTDGSTLVVPLESPF